jgi:2-dehydro-3-deoxygluconokinase
MTAAKNAGAVTSFDLNFREKLWKISGGADRAVEVIGRIVEHVDVLVGNEEDLQKGLGIEGPKVEDKTKSKLDPSVFFEMIDKVVKKQPQVKAVATTLREVHSRIGTAGARWRGWMGRRTRLRRRSWMFMIA